ncbi:hypothetical protein [Brevundimonas sp. 'scallop']|uniref:hypothetical protein n=1 Tax=Brevundimonas sp. 'scallop' TaxID=2562582 RepID=UPI0013E12F6C|nr:hypothetical protein [Brevundimonas sp. 'scallop']QIF82868.1 hypothetical protein E4341_14890 [Brevundimonas sp. 'scallop']
MTATTIPAQARQALGLRKNIGKEAALKEMKAIRKENHPDTSGGEFISDSQKTRYLLSDSFINALEREEASGNLPAVNDGRDAAIDLIKAISTQNDEDRKIAAADRAKQEILSVRHELEKATSQPFHAPKFSLWGFGSVGLILVAAQAPLETVSSRVGADSGMVTVVLGAASAISLLAGLVAQSAENISKQHVRHLLTERGVALVVAVLNDEHRLYGESIALDDFTEAVSMVVGTADHASCEEAARVITSQLTDRGLLKKRDDISFSQQYDPTDEIRSLSFRFRDQARMIIKRHKIKREMGPFALLASPIFSLLGRR